MAETMIRAWKVIPFFRSTSITSTIDFYTSLLSFKAGPPHPPPPAKPGFVSLSCGPNAAVNIYFVTGPEDEPAPSGRAMVALEKPEDVNMLWSHLKNERVIQIVNEARGEEALASMTKVKDEPWGYRQFVLCDIDGNELTFFAFVDIEDAPENEAEEEE